MMGAASGLQLATTFGLLAFGLHLDARPSLTSLLAIMTHPFDNLNTHKPGLRHDSCPSSDRARMLHCQKLTSSPVQPHRSHVRHLRTSRCVLLLEERAEEPSMMQGGCLAVTQVLRGRAPARRRGSQHSSRKDHISCHCLIHSAVPTYRFLVPSQP